jgi:hypothetical protein
MDTIQKPLTLRRECSMAEKRCTRCILPETYPGITFDKNGVCHICNSYRKPEVKGEDELRKLINSGKGEKYDCLVTLSGGRDSTYVLYYAVKALGLRTLSLHYDNGFRHSQAYKNTKTVCAKLGTDLVEFNSKDNLNVRATVQAIRATIPFGPGTACQFMCRPCYNGGLGALYSTAEKYGIPFILWGDTRVEELSFQSMKHQVMNFHSPLRYAFSYRWFSFLKYVYLFMVQRRERLPSGNLPIEFHSPKLRNPKIKEISLFHYVEWNRGEIKRTITEELGWQKPPDALSTWRFDCYLHKLVNYCFKKAVGFNHDIDGLANMVRAGKMDRAEAMDLIGKGFDSGEWDEGLEELTKNVLKLPQSDIHIIKSW